MNIGDLHIIIRGAGDLATGVALRLHRAGFKKLLLLETAHPLAVRRQVSFCEAVTLGKVTVENVTGMYIRENLVPSCMQENKEREIPIFVDPAAGCIKTIQPQVVIDAIIAKRNTGTHIDDAELVIGLGPGFTAGTDVNCVIETMRGHNLGRVIYNGSALPDTGTPGSINGYTDERLLRAPQTGIFITAHDIGDRVAPGDCIAIVNDKPVVASIHGVLRGLLRSETPVDAGTKLGDIDPRGNIDSCTTASDKAMSIGGGVLEAILWYYNGYNGKQET